MLYKRFTDEEIKELYTTDGYDMGFEKGTAYGAHNEKISIAASMKSEGIDTAVIEKCTGLSPEEIDAI